MDGNTNRITTGGYGYDLNGNLTTLPGVTGIAYDADNRLTAAKGEQYSYTPANQRVWLKKGGLPTEHFTFYGVDGARVGVYTKANYSAPLTGSYFTVVRQEVYFAGKRIRSGGLAVAEDRLGSARMDGTTASRYYPYGEEFTPTTASDRQKFGTYYRDAGTQLDYANQRYYSSAIGRFLTADPYQASGGPADPGSWNRYAYVQGDPVNWHDPGGLQRIRCYDVPEGAGGGPYCLGDADSYDQPLLPNPEQPRPTPEPPIVDPGIAWSLKGLLKIKTGDFKLKQDCRNFFAQLIKDTKVNVDVDTLMDSVASVAAEAYSNGYMYDGPSSTTQLANDKFPGAASPGIGTVGDVFRASPGLSGFSQFNGSAIWIRTDDWVGMMSPYLTFSLGQAVNSLGLGTIMHEILHKKAVGGGFSHGQMTTSLMNMGGWAPSVGPNDIANSLGRLCF